MQVFWLERLLSVSAQQQLNGPSEYPEKCMDDKRIVKEESELASEPCREECSGMGGHVSWQT